MEILAHMIWPDLAPDKPNFNQILLLMKMGCTLIFKSNYMMKGDPANGYIDLGIVDPFNMPNEYSPDGVEELSYSGVKRSWEIWKAKYEEEGGNDEG